MLRAGPKVTIRRDTAGIANILKSTEVAQAMRGEAERVATHTRAALPAGTDVVVDDYVTDRAASSVTIRDARGRLWQVRNGVLTRAASAAGLDIKGIRED